MHKYWIGVGPLSMFVLSACVMLLQCERTDAVTLQYIIERGLDLQNHLEKSEVADYFGLVDSGVSKCYGAEVRDWCKARNAEVSPSFHYKCFCRCLSSSSTFVGDHGVCLSNSKVRELYGGCDLYTAVENASSRLTVLNLRGMQQGSIPIDTLADWCSLNLNFSYYFDKGHAKPFSTAGPVKFTSRQMNHKQIRVWWDGLDTGEIYSGKLMRLNVSCNLNVTIPAQKACFLFKAAGTVYYNSTVIVPSRPSSVIDRSSTPYHHFASSTSSLSSSLLGASSGGPPVLFPTPAITTSIISPSPPSHDTTTTSSVHLATSISPSAPPTTKNSGDVDSWQSPLSPGAIAGAVLAALLAISATVALAYCRIKRPIRRRSPRRNRIDITDRDVILSTYQKEPGDRQDTPDGEFNYAFIVDGPSVESSQSCHSLKNAWVNPTESAYQSLEQNKDSDQGSIYNSLDEHTRQSRGPLTDTEKEPDEYQRLTEAGNESEYELITAAPDDESTHELQAIYNVLESPAEAASGAGSDYEVGWSPQASSSDPSSNMHATENRVSDQHPDYVEIIG